MRRPHQGGADRASTAENDIAGLQNEELLCVQMTTTGILRGRPNISKDLLKDYLNHIGALKFLLSLNFQSLLCLGVMCFVRGGLILLVFWNFFNIQLNNCFRRFGWS